VVTHRSKVQDLFISVELLKIKAAKGGSVAKRIVDGFDNRVGGNVEQLILRNSLFNQGICLSIQKVGLNSCCISGTAVHFSQSGGEQEKITDFSMVVRRKPARTDIYLVETLYYGTESAEVYDRKIRIRDGRLLKVEENGKQKKLNHTEEQLVLWESQALLEASANALNKVHAS